VDDNFSEGKRKKQRKEKQTIDVHYRTESSAFGMPTASTQHWNWNFQRHPRQDCSARRQ